MARDCTVKADPNAPPSQQQPTNKGNFDSEYASLMAELGESASGGADSGRPSWGGGSTGHDFGGGGSNVPPWRRPEMWQSTVNTQPSSNQGYRPPQAGGYGASNYPGYGGAAGGYGQGAWPQAAAGGAYPQGYSQDYSAAYAQYYQGQYNQMQTANPTA